MLTKLVDRCNRFNPSLYSPLLITCTSKLKTVGCVLKSNVQFLRTPKMQSYVHVDERDRILLKGRTYEERTIDMKKMTSLLLESSLVGHTLRHEYYGERTVFHVDRAVSTFWGIPQFGTHLNGIVLNDNNKLSHIWLGLRSKTKHPFPNLYDSLVGGGYPTNNVYSVSRNMLKEAYEEAGISQSRYLNNIKSTSVVSYVNDEPRGLKNNTMVSFNF